MSIRVAIVEDEPSVRRSLAPIIDLSPGLSCVETCDSTERALQRLPACVPDVVLMDIHLPGRSGVECVGELKRILPKTQFLMLTIHEDAQCVFDSLKAVARFLNPPRSPIQR